ncbi:MAG: DUF2251 domain-containing protein [Dyella sp.]|uniref:DUF2251 domain-containing protein n=1 Tax=Dyella sp. TaxID=1869338 RepID=UPI003F7FED66
MPVNVVTKQKITVGTEEFVESAAPDGSFVVAFEDDGDTGYFYALDHSQSGQSIQDAMHIYNATNVSDKHPPSVVEIGWSSDNCKAVLLINDYAHAIFDFSAKRGYCRTGFPPPSENWRGHDWDDSAFQLFAVES